jgi:hypothetical protein
MGRNPLAALPALFAEIKLEHRLLGWTLVLAFLVAGGILLILWAKSWLPGKTPARPAEPSLEEYRRLLEEGTLGFQEFERIRARLDPAAAPPEVDQGIQDPQLHRGIRRPPSSASDPTC